MANKKLFSRKIAIPAAPPTNAVNEAGGVAYALGAKHGLAQFAATGCLNGTYYASAETQLASTLGFANAVEPEFLAKTAVYAREQGFMKDLPALLAVVLSKREPKLLRKIFGRVVDDARMLRTFVQILRSGAAGRKSLGTAPKALVRKWLEGHSEEELFRASVGNDPRLADIVKMMHPKPATPERAALYGYLIGRPHETERLPELVRAFESWKKDRAGAPPKVPFQMLTALELGRDAWAEIARNATWTQTRMNLNAFARHGVFDVPGLTEKIAARLRNPEEVRRSRVFPYQLLMAYLATRGRAEVPAAVANALQDALEVAIENVPALGGKVVVCPDVSGSMGSPVTGHRQGATTAVRCIDVAALVAAALLRKNPDAEVLPFEESVVTKLQLNARDAVVTNATKLAGVGGGGTNCSAPLAALNARKAKADLVVYVSDNQSWVDVAQGRSGTRTMQEWEAFRARNPKAKLVMIDLQPYATAQVKDRDEILLVGGFSDQVFSLLATFAKGELAADHWVGVIERVQLDEPARVVETGADEDAA